MALKKEWSFLPQTIQKKKTVVFEPKPWRCHFCKSDAVRFSSFTGLKKHMQVHKLVDREDFTKFEPPSARPGKIVSFTVKNEWNKLKAEHSKTKPKKMTAKQQRDDARSSKSKSDKKNRVRIPKDKWPALIQEWDDDTSFAKKDFCNAHPEFQNHQQRISLFQVSYEVC